MRVYCVMDDYTPDAGSTFYGAWAKEEDAQKYIDEGIHEDYGEKQDTENLYIREVDVQ